MSDRVYKYQLIATIISRSARIGHMSYFSAGAAGMSQRTDFLKDLMRANAPGLVATVQDEAVKGNPHAQYALGLIYAEGRGVRQNPVEAYAWLTVAVLQGDNDAELLRNHVAVDMTDDEFDEGKRCAARYQEELNSTVNRLSFN